MLERNWSVQVLTLVGMLGFLSGVSRYLSYSLRENHTTVISVCHANLFFLTVLCLKGTRNCFWHFFLFCCTCIGLLTALISVSHMCAWCLKKIVEIIGSPGTGVPAGCELTCRRLGNRGRSSEEVARATSLLNHSYSPP